MVLLSMGLGWPFSGALTCETVTLAIVEAAQGAQCAAARWSTGPLVAPPGTATGLQLRCSGGQKASTDLLLSPL